MGVATRGPVGGWVHDPSKFAHGSSGVTLPFSAPLLIFAAPTNFLLSPKKKKKKKKKGRHFFSVFLIGFLPPWSFLYPKYFFRVDRTLSWPRYGRFCYFVKRFFVQKNLSLVMCRPPKVPPPAGVAGAVVTPLHGS